MDSGVGSDSPPQDGDGLINKRSKPTLADKEVENLIQRLLAKAHLAEKIDLVASNRPMRQQRLKLLTMVVSKSVQPLSRDFGIAFA